MQHVQPIGDGIDVERCRRDHCNSELRCLLVCQLDAVPSNTCGSNLCSHSTQPASLDRAAGWQRRVLEARLPHGELGVQQHYLAALRHELVRRVAVQELPHLLAREVRVV